MVDKKEFWVMNISNRNVCIGDLSICMAPKQIINLLDTKGYSFTEEQLDKSQKSGSLFKKRDKIKKLNEKPKFNTKTTKKKSQIPMMRRRKLSSKVDEPKYDELLFSDEEFADEMSNIPVCSPNNASPK